MRGGGGPLVGRERELDVLSAWVARAGAGAGGVALVTGEPGIGKTRLLQEMAARAADQGFSVAWGRAYEVGGAPPYWPWIEILRALFGRPGGRDPNAAALARLLPELGGPGSERGEADRFQLYDAVTSYLHGAAGREPLLLVLDDLHAADPSSLELCELVARQLGGMRVALLGSHRDVEARRSQAIDVSLGRLGRLGEVLELERLGLAAVEVLVSEATGRDDRESAQMIRDATEGNPLFVRELLRLLADRDRGAARPGVPAGVRAVIRERLALLAPATVALLQAAAVVGREFTISLAAEIAGVTAEAIEEAASEARAAELLGEAGPGRLRFSHALVAETLAADLPAVLRARHHRRAAEAIERRHADDPAPPLDEIAHHWLESGTGGAAMAVAAAEAGQERGGLLRRRRTLSRAGRWRAIRARGPGARRGGHGRQDRRAGDAPPGGGPRPPAARR